MRVVAVANVEVETYRFGRLVTDVISLQTAVYLRPLSAYLNLMGFDYLRDAGRAGTGYARVVHPGDDVDVIVRAVVALLQKNNLAIELDVRELA